MHSTCPSSRIASDPFGASIVTLVKVEELIFGVQKTRCGLTGCTERRMRSQLRRGYGRTFCIDGVWSCLNVSSVVVIPRLKEWRDWTCRMRPDLLPSLPTRLHRNAPLPLIFEAGLSNERHLLMLHVRREPEGYLAIVG